MKWKSHHEEINANLSRQVEALQHQLHQQSKQNLHSTMELEQNLLAQMALKKKEWHQEMAALQMRINQFMSEREDLNFSAGKSKEKEKEWTLQLQTAHQMREQLVLDHEATVIRLTKKIEELNTTVASLTDKNNSLRQHLSDLENEIQEKDDEYVIKMKELQISINHLMERKSTMRKHLHHKEFAV